MTPAEHVATRSLENIPTTMPNGVPLQPVAPMPDAERVHMPGVDDYNPATQAMPYEQYPGYAPETMGQPAPKRKRRGGRIAVAILLVLAIAAGAGAAGFNMYLNNLNQNLAGDEQEAAEVKEELTAVPPANKPFYLLLMGCDDREGVEGARSDTTILARLDPKKNRVTLISIPRDTMIELEDHGTEKFNAAYTYGGPSGTIAAAKELCGVDISHYAEVHFEALIDIIDYIGGVDVDVPIGIDDVDAGGVVEAGKQHLDGEHAMIFARSRSYETGDFQRTTSQRLLIEAAVKKVLKMDPTEYPGLLMKVSESMNTDFTVQELLGLAQAFTDEPKLKMFSAMVPSTTADVDGVSYVITDQEKFDEMMKLVNKGKDPSKVQYEDNTVKSSKEAEKQGIQVIPNAGDETYGVSAYGNDYSEDYSEGYYEDEDYSEDDGSADGETYEEETYEDETAYDGGYEEDYSEEGY